MGNTATERRTVEPAESSEAGARRDATTIPIAAKTMNTLAAIPTCRALKRFAVSHESRSDVVGSPWVAFTTSTAETAGAATAGSAVLTSAISAWALRNRTAAEKRYPRRATV